MQSSIKVVDLHAEGKKIEAADGKTHPKERMGIASAISSLIVGCVIGIDYVTQGVALASLIFVGSLAVSLSLGAKLFFVSTIACTLLMLFTRPVPFATGMAQNLTIPILAPIIFVIVSGMAAETLQVQFATVVAILGLTTIASAAVFLAAGSLSASGYFKLMPYPVIAGFMAGTGWQFIYAALNLLTEEQALLAMAGTIFENPILPQVASMVVIAVIMVWLDRARLFPSAPLVFLLAVIAVFFSVLYLGDLVQQAVASGLFLKTNEATNAQSGDVSFNLTLWWDISWSHVAVAGPAIVAAAALNFIGFGLNHSGLQLSTGATINIDREFQRSGVMNMLIGFFGGITSFLGIGSSLLSQRMGGRIPLLSIGILAVMVLGVSFSEGITASVPRFAAAALLTYMGFALVYDWLYLTWFRLERGEWLIIFTIFFVTVALGFLLALVVGLFLALVLFVVTYRRLGIIGGQGSGTNFVSTVRRSPQIARYLRERAHEIHVLKLRGFLFFASVDSLEAKLESLLSEEQPPSHVILDLTTVLGADSTALTSLMSLKGWAQRNNTTLVLAGANHSIISRLKKAGLESTRLMPGKTGQFETGLFHADKLDDALEDAENSVVAPLFENRGSQSFNKLFLTSDFMRIPSLARLIALKRTTKFAPGEIVISPGDGSDAIYLITSGRVEIRTEPKLNEGDRLASFAESSLFGDLDYFQKEPNNVYAIAALESRIYVFTREEIERMEEEDPKRALAFHKFLASSLSEKLLLMRSL